MSRKNKKKHQREQSRAEANDNENRQTSLHQNTASLQESFNGESFNLKNKAIAPRNDAQKDYMQALADHSVVFGLGPAGTGKTYLAVAKAVEAFQKGEVKRIILCRPAVEAGEKLGFLPGSANEKIDPYMRPLFDALVDMIPAGSLNNLRNNQQIEIAPLAFMRGRTLNDAYIILDEAQNTTVTQMKMLLTRMGNNSKMIITGDESQIDLPDGERSGLIEAAEALKGVEDIHIHHFDDGDVVRHELVGKMIRAMDQYAQGRKAPDAAPKPEGP